MRYKYEIKIFNAALVIFVYIIMAIYSCVYAQPTQRVKEVGCEFSIGLHDFRCRNENLELAGIGPSARGIGLGYFFGNSLLKTRLRGLGYYESTGNSGNKFYQYEAESLINFYPLEFARTRKHVIDVYLSMGLSYTYLNFDNHVSGYPSNSFNRLSQSTAIGGEYLIRTSSKVVYVFCEVMMGSSLSGRRGEQSQYSALAEIASSLNIGLRVSYPRK